MGKVKVLCKGVGKRGELEILRLKPGEIETALKHCTTEEQCDDCPLLHTRYGYCGQVLNEEALKYIEILKELNKTFAQRVEDLEINCEKLLQELEILD